MKLTNYEQNTQLIKTLEFSAREWTVEVTITVSAMTISFSYEGELRGQAVFNHGEMEIVYKLLNSLFVEGKRGREFNYDTPTLHNPALPSVQIRSTNWGEPYAQGIEWVFCSHPDINNDKDLYFKLYSSDCKDFLVALEAMLVAEVKVEKKISALDTYFSNTKSDHIFRLHRGGIKESLATSRPCISSESLLAQAQAAFPDKPLTIETMLIETYCYDRRIDRTLDMLKDQSGHILGFLHPEFNIEEL
jgi:hypothetical protein